MESVFYIQEYVSVGISLSKNSIYMHVSYLVTYICKYCPVTAGYFQAGKEVQSCVFMWVVGGVGLFV